MSYKTKEEFVAEHLREGILAGRYPRGTRLKQADVAEELQLSITPVREAFRILEAEGYVHNETHRGVVVAPFDPAATTEINELRILLESRLVVAAMERMTPADFAQITRVQNEFEAAEARRDRESVRALNYRFHSALYALAGQPQTLHFVQILWAKYPFDLINQIGGRAGRASAEHRHLLKAVRAGDRKTVKAAVREHIEAGWRELTIHMEQQKARAGANPAQSRHRAGK